MKKFKFESQDVATTLEEKISGLINLKDEGIFSNNVDVAVRILMQAKFKEKEKKVLETHKYAITQTTITKNGKRYVRWQTTCGDNRPRCSTYEALIERLYSYYFDNNNVINDYSFKTVFEAALKEKINTERPKEKTIRDYNSSFAALITDGFACKDIRKITQSELQQYIMDTVINLDLTKKRLLKLKGLLNLTFTYATNPEHRILVYNPVPENNSHFLKHCRLSKNKPEEKAFQPEEIDTIREYLWNRVSKRKYDVNGYAILFASWVGLREAEIPALKWSDITETAIHIHAQQNDEMQDGVKTFYYNPTTKNEKGISKDGRYFPMNSEIKRILDELRNKQQSLGINSEWVFAKADGTWTTTSGYYKALYNLSKKLDLNLTNNHAFRIALNSYVLIPMGIPVTERAKMLGHSVDTNLKYYSFARSNEYLEELSVKWDDYIESMNCSKRNGRGTLGYLEILGFSKKEKSQKTANFQALH